MSLRVIPYEKKYQSALVEFFKKQSADHPELSDPEMIRWERSKRFLALSEETIIGQISQIPHLFKKESQPYNLGWAATLVLDESNQLRQVFAGTKLLDKVTKESELPFAAVGVVPEIEESHKRRGYQVSHDSTAMYARFYHPAKALKFLNKSTVFSLPITIVNLAMSQAKADKQITVKKIESFDSDHDSIWDAYLSMNYPFYGVRTADYLNYKLTQPKKEYHARIAYDTGIQPVGYIIYRLARNEIKNISLVKICDLVGTEKAKKTLVSQATAFARDKAADGIIALSSLRDKAMFRSCGLWVAKPYPVVLPPEIVEPIHVSFFDSDLDHLW